MKSQRTSVTKRRINFFLHIFAVHMSPLSDWQSTKNNFRATSPKEQIIVSVQSVEPRLSRKRLVTATLTASAYTDVNYKWVISRESSWHRKITEGPRRVAFSREEGKGNESERAIVTKARSYAIRSFREAARRAGGGSSGPR